jgi:hypothetical protein
MKTVLLDLFTSKKFLTALSAVIIWAGGRFGFDVDPETLDRIFMALLVYVGAQGVADAGKSAAQVKAGAAKIASVALVLLLAVGCTKQQIATGVTAGMGCERPAIAAAAGELYGWAVSRIAATIAGGTVDSAKLRAAMSNIIDVSPRCAIEAAVAAAATPPEAARSTLAQTRQVDGAALRAEYERAKADLGWPALKGGV